MNRLLSHNGFIALYFKFLILSLTLLALGGCSENNDGAWEGNGGVGEVRFLQERVSSSKQNNRLKIAAPQGVPFEAELISEGDWCSFEARNTTLTKKGTIPAEVFVYFSENKSSVDRTVKVRVTALGATFEAQFTQEAYSASSRYDRAWGEQPAYKQNDTYTYKTYFTELSNGKKVRNYSICYDRSKRVSHWVAYPLHTCYTQPNVGRSDAWSYDPNDQMPVIPENDQQYILESYKSGYVRGHQIASADRYNTVATNRMTFYATNMMPQNYDFNGGHWAKLEGHVRSQIVRDTLFVVTGTYFGDGRTMRDRHGNTIAVPSHCWKVLLRTTKGNTGKSIAECRANELQAIGFWMENRDYGSEHLDLKKYTLSVEEIEKRTGFQFFRNIPQDAASAVKRQNNPSDWKIY